MVLKRRGQQAEVAGGAARRHVHVEIAAGDLLRRADQPADRRDEAAREAESDPDRREEHDQRHAGEDDAEGDLNAEPVRLKLLVFGGVLLRQPKVARDASDRSAAPDRDRRRRSR